ncbi:MAG: Gfo/Idh/MocA family oxidoreductase [Spirochaetaceae bacterium]|nr:MAG: Gfo/Idh/MocA family oxidoreductase [Spirochaetaceae bacterium]
MKIDNARVGIVGLGLVAYSHLKGYRSHPSAEVAAVCDLNDVRADRFAKENGIPKVYTSYDEMLADAEINVVDIATPTHMHATMTAMAATTGKHVLCEKPFCRYMGEGLLACRSGARKGVKIMVGETYVFLSSHMKARELLEAGEIGRPLQIRQRHGAWLEKEQLHASDVPADRSWRLDPAQSGGGAFPWIFDHAVHFFSTAEYLMLDIPVREVFAVTADNRGVRRQKGAAHDPYSTAEIDIPIITWKYEDPACHGVWIRAERLNGKYDYMLGFNTAVIGDRGMIEVLGEGGGRLFWDGAEQHLLLHREGKDTLTFRFDEGGDDVWKSEISYYSQGHIRQIHHFLDCLVNDREPRYTGENGVRVVQCTLAAIRSARENRPVRVEEIGEDYKAYE